jgi:ubiquinone/menaquinone biosynthesis C-methylase UbiE
MNPYARYVLPWMIEVSCGVAPIRELRSALIPRAHGRVLEVGVGTGHNLPYYDRSRVTELIALDPAEQMHGKAQARAASAGVDVRVLGLSAEQIPLQDNEVDTVVMTFTLCSIPDPETAVAELARVLRPGGELIFAEHGRAPSESARRWQRRLNPVQRRVGGGCHLDRDISALLRTRMQIRELDEQSVGSMVLGYVYSGVATPDHAR